MSTNSATEKTISAQKPVRLPPEEKFWKRYSPHSELPLSAIGSFALHFLGIGMLILLAWLGWFGFRKNSGAVPVEVVHFAPGGGGGKKTGVGPSKGIGSGAEPVDTDTKTDENPPPPDPDPNRAKLDPNAVALAPETVQKDDAFKRMVQSGNPNLNIFSRVEKTALNKFRDGLQPGKGEGGTGSGGGTGDGTGTGDGNATGPGQRGALNQRERRMLRWTMIFNTRSGADYLSQLRGMGAVLAVPTGADNKSYKIIRDLSGQRSPKLLDEDISKIQCIFWVDDRPDSVRSLVSALHLGFMPNHIVAFMPRELEEKLFEMEKRAANGVPEDQILDTRFDVVRVGRGYEPRVVGVKTRP